jgi:ABC-type uncharacterized transport system involved in gliding motility auxiliary subunit
MSRTCKTILAVVLVIISTFSLITALQYLTRDVRADLTEHRLYTLSEPTRKILDKVDQPLEMTLYYSRNLALTGPQWIRDTYDYFTYVQDLLREYERASEGKIRLEVVDPRPFSQAEEQAVAADVDAIPISAPDEKQREYFYFALTVRSEFGRVEVLELFDPADPFDQYHQNLLEYNITRTIDKIVTPRARRIGLIESLRMQGMRGMPMRPGSPPWPLLSVLENRYEVVGIPAQAQEIPEVDLLLIVHPKGLSDRLRFAIDQWVLAGNPTIVAVDPLCVAEQFLYSQQQLMQGVDLSSDLPELLAAWGVQMGDGVLCDEILSPEAGMPAAGTRDLARLNLEPRNFATDHPVTSELQRAFLLLAGGLTPLDKPGLTFTPLLHSSRQGVVVPRGGQSLMEYFADLATRYDSIRQAQGPQERTLAMACVVRGKASSAFPNGLELPDVDEEDLSAEGSGAGPDEAEESGQEGESQPPRLTGLTASTAAINVIVMADVDFLHRAYYPISRTRTMALGDNGPFLLNAIDYLTGSQDLLEIRGSKIFERPFKAVRELESQAQEKIAEKTLELRQERETLKREQEEALEKMRAEGRFSAGELMKFIQEGNELIRQKDREMRSVQNVKRQSVEQLGQRLQKYNMFVAPAVILLISLLLTAYRIFRRRMFLRRVVQS